MISSAQIPVFDGHNDVLLRLHLGGGDPVAAFLDGQGGAGHLDLPRARAAGFAGGLFAIFVPSPAQAAAASTAAQGKAGEGTQNLGPGAHEPEEVGLAGAQAATLAMASLLVRIARASDGRVRICRSVADIRAAMADGAQASVLHIEGAEAIDADLAMLDVLHQAGLRSLGPVWSRPNIFGFGVPFRFPSPPDIGPGLTDAGKRLIAACNDLRILIDLSHLNEAGFWDVARLSNAPLVATHSNAHAICAASRNLTDKQLAAIRDSGGLVGVNYAVSFLRPDGARNADTPIDVVVDHLAYMVERLGEDGVALGSDFDGALIAAGMGSVSGLPALIAAMRTRGFGDALIEKICHHNWLGVLERTWGA
ncbi:MAG: peptidase [Proteobacteria bacterium]|nr:MAG: peptidase [Pseudomonadota bacterium]